MTYQSILEVTYRLHDPDRLLFFLDFFKFFIKDRVLAWQVVGKWEEAITNLNSAITHWPIPVYPPFPAVSYIASSS